MPAGWTDTLLIGALVALALVIRLRRMTRAQRLRPASLWIVPAIFLAFAGLVYVEAPPNGWGWLWVAIGFALGSATGWQRARFVDIHRDPDSGHLYQRSSPNAFLFLGALIVFRWLFHVALDAGDARWHLGAMLVADIVIAFAAGVLIFFRIEIFLRARKL